MKMNERKEPQITAAITPFLYNTTFYRKFCTKQYFSRKGLLTIMKHQKRERIVRSWYGQYGCKIKD